MRTSRNGGPAMAGPLLAVVGGGLLAVGALLPWIDIRYARPAPRGTMVTRTYAQSGWAYPEGQIVFFAGLAIAAAGIYIVGAVTARGIGALVAAATTVIAVAVLAAWWERLPTGGDGGHGVLVSAAGALVALAGILLSFPGSRGWRIALFAGICGTSLCGFGLALLVVKAPLIPTF